ncbi:hypothetical protein ALP33_01190 [Pseudomonas amygdali pv. lachrymans]|uniref:Uncharacterized protein n=1 Tax=Pseudomonas amygdali pv. lachrymans TaxID=53707 RepID=A0AB37RCJ4_PSEAV|nr:hypothetical protein ALP33_01190 [Pseudomonas amygdali pv. lachrymans]
MGSSQKLHCAQVGQFSTGRVGQFCIGTDNKRFMLLTKVIDDLLEPLLYYQFDFNRNRPGNTPS